MPTGSDYIGDERRRVANLVASTALWTERRNAQGNAVGQDAPAALRELTQGRLEDLEGHDLHRRFQVRLVRGREHQPNTVGPLHDVDADIEVLIGYLVRGGTSATPGAPQQLDEVAAQDTEAVRQRLWHPDNRTAGTTGPLYTSGITAGRVVQVIVGPAERIVDEPPSRGARQIWRITLTSWLRVDTEAA